MIYVLNSMGSVHALGGFILSHLALLICEPLFCDCYVAAGYVGVFIREREVQ
jgi:hypothetical protein